MKKHLTNTIQILCMTLCILGCPSVARADCSSTLTQCSNQTDCESEKGFWENGQCVATITPPPITCTSSALNQCTTPADCEGVKGFWVNESCSSTPPTVTCSSSALNQCTTPADCEGVKGFWVNESCSSTPPTVTCSSSALNQCTTPADCEGVKGFWENGQCKVAGPIITPTGTELPILKVFGIDNAGQSISGINSKFAGGISSDSGKSFIDAIQTPVELKKGGSIQIKGEITPDSSHSGKSAEIIVVGLHTSDINDTSCDLAIGKHTYYMMVDATPTSEIYCEWKEGGECKDDNNLPRVKSKNSADSYYTEWTRWDTTLANLKPSRTVPSIEKLEETLYVDNNLNYTGFICVNFGYRLDDKTLIFNAEPLKFRVSE